MYYSFLKSRQGLPTASPRHRRQQLGACLYLGQLGLGRERALVAPANLVLVPCRRHRVQVSSRQSRRERRGKMTSERCWVRLLHTAYVPGSNMWDSLISEFGILIVHLTHVLWSRILFTIGNDYEGMSLPRNNKDLVKFHICRREVST